MSDYPVDEEELLSKFDIKQTSMVWRSYMRRVELTDTNSGDKFMVYLSWDMDDGFTLYTDDKPSPALQELMDRPEFEYTIDSILEDRNNE